MSESKGEFVIEQEWPQAMLTTGIRAMIEDRMRGEAAGKLLMIFQDARTYQINCSVGWEELGLTERYQIRLEWKEIREGQLTFDLEENDDEG